MNSQNSVPIQQSIKQRILGHILNKYQIIKTESRNSVINSLYTTQEKKFINGDCK